MRRATADDALATGNRAINCTVTCQGNGGRMRKRRALDLLAKAGVSGLCDTAQRGERQGSERHFRDTLKLQNLARLGWRGDLEPEPF